MNSFVAKTKNWINYDFVLLQVVSFRTRPQFTRPGSSGRRLVMAERLRRRRATSHSRRRARLRIPATKTPTTMTATSGSSLPGFSPGNVRLTSKGTTRLFSVRRKTRNTIGSSSRSGKPFCRPRTLAPKTCFSLRPRCRRLFPALNHLEAVSFRTTATGWRRPQAPSPTTLKA